MDSIRFGLGIPQQQLRFLWIFFQKSPLFMWFVISKILKQGNTVLKGWAILVSIPWLSILFRKVSIKFDEARFWFSGIDTLVSMDTLVSKFEYRHSRNLSIGIKVSILGRNIQNKKCSKTGFFRENCWLGWGVKARFLVETAD